VQLATARLRSVNRDVTRLGAVNGVRLATASGVGLAWIEGSDFTEGTIEADVCGRDVYQESFVGLAFHRRDDETYEAVYLRPFNFRSMSSERRQHAVQYTALPEYGYERLRHDFPGEFEKPVDHSVNPTGWNHLRLVVRSRRLQVFVGKIDTPALEVREVLSESHGQVGLYVDNGSDGVFANVRIVHKS
jgi:hypothetical protein